MAKTLTEIALDEALADPPLLAAAAEEADAAGQPLVVALVRSAGVGEVALVAAIRRQIRVAVTDPASVTLDSDALREVPRELCQRRRVLPLSVEMHGAGPRTLRLAMADPTDQVALAEVEHVTACRVDPTLMTLSAIEELIDTGYRGFVTQVMKRERKAVYGEAPSEAEPKQAAPSATMPVETQAQHGTMPHHRVADEADLELRLRALVRVLIAKGVLGEDEYDEAVRALLKRRDE